MDPAQIGELEPGVGELPSFISAKYPLGAPCAATKETVMPFVVTEVKFIDDAAFVGSAARTTKVPLVAEVRLPLEICKAETPEDPNWKFNGKVKVPPMKELGVFAIDSDGIAARETG